jgi:5-methylcytosine-specific restriction endonuclease McrA
MPRLSERDRGPIALAEKILNLLDQGAFTATYKYAVLLALIDLCMETTAASGAPAQAFTSRQLAEKGVELYWPHSGPYHVGGRARVLRQFRSAQRQARIVSEIQRFKVEVAKDPTISLPAARLGFPNAYGRLIDRVEWKLIQDPLPRLQLLGGRVDEFLYTIGWDLSVRESEVRSYQRGDAGAFDNRILLRPGVGEHLLQLNSLLRPLIHRQWAAMVARINELEESRLEAFLFGAERAALDRVRDDLRELQGDRCFYCDHRLGEARGRRAHVDHFVPWARYPNNAIQNLVVAHERCNGEKRDFLAATPHVERWRTRVEPDSPDGAKLVEVAGRVGWEQDPARTLSVARAVYLTLPQGYQLWLRRREFEELDPSSVRALLS